MKRARSSGLIRSTTRHAEPPHWVFDFESHEGKRRHLSEVTSQEWRGDKIWRERFFYDKASSGWK